MEVDRQPSPWPCVAMLAGLLLLSLMAPRYWRSSDSADATQRPAHKKQAAPKRTVFVPFGIEEQRRYFPFLRAPVADFDPLDLWAPPTIEELVAARAGMRHYQGQLIEWPVIALPAVRSAREPLAAPVATPESEIMSATFQLAGRLLVDYSPMDAAAEVSARIAEIHRWWSSQPAVVSGRSPRPTTLRLVGPGDRLSMVPPQSEPAPSETEPSARAPRGDGWCVPQVLLQQLQRLAHHPSSADWAERTIGQLYALTKRDHLEGDDVQSILEALSDSAQQAARMAESTGEDCLRVELLRAHWSLARRLDCWTTIHEIRVAERAQERIALHGPIESFFNKRPGGTVAVPRGAALSADLETYEHSRDPRLGRQVVGRQQALQTSADALDRSLADAVEQHYRNANVRIAVTAEFLNRLVSREHSEARMLRDRIAGTPISGHSHVQSGSRVQLHPTEGRWQMTVEANGVVDARTLADGGPARLRSVSATEFAARKSILVDPNGVRLQQTTVDATSHNRLVGVTTDFDWVPLLGSFVRERAVTQYRARSGRARSEIEQRVSSQAVAQLDRETQDAVHGFERRFRQRLTGRLARAGVDLTPIEMTTTHQRVVGRFRVAGEHQLGSHTPRPRALSDSLASVQVHESALTNAAVSLSLDGGRYSGAELQQLLREQFPRLATNGEVVRRDVMFYFAQEDALQVHIGDGRLELTLTLAGIVQDGRPIRDFVVHAYYVPVVNGLEAELVRDGSLGIEGRLSSADRARLHNVFQSVLSPDRRLPIVRLDNPNDPRLEGLMITQLVLEDGWLGLAVGPAYGERVAERSRSLR